MIFDFLKILIDLFSQPIFSYPSVVMAIEPVTTAATVITIISTVTQLLKGTNFTSTQHLTFDQAAEQARAIRPSFVAQWIAEKGLTEKTVSEQAIRLVNYLRARDGQASWAIMSGTIANDVQNGIAQYAYSNPTQLINYASEVWILFCLMNYDAKRPDDFSQQIVYRTKEVFAMDISQPSQAGAASAGKNINGAIDSLFDGVKTLFGLNTDPASGGSQGGGGISQTTMLIGFGLLILLILIFKK